MGMTIEEVRDQFDMPRLDAFNKYQAKHPPLHVMVGAYLGVGEKEKPKSTNNGDIAPLLQELGMMA